VEASKRVRSLGQTADVSSCDGRQLMSSFINVLLIVEVVLVETPLVRRSDRSLSPPHGVVGGVETKDDVETKDGVERSCAWRR
jgi:hypothetical protein